MGEDAKAPPIASVEPLVHAAPVAAPAGFPVIAQSERIFGSPGQRGTVIPAGLQQRRHFFSRNPQRAEAVYKFLEEASRLLRGGSSEPDPARDLTPSSPDFRQRVIALQTRLNEAGANPLLATDGKIGPLTAAALRQQIGTPGAPDPAASPRPDAPPRADAPAAEQPIRADETAAQMRERIERESQAPQLPIPANETATQMIARLERERPVARPIAGADYELVDLSAAAPRSPVQPRAQPPG